MAFDTAEVRPKKYKLALNDDFMSIDGKIVQSLGSDEIPYLERPTAF